MSTTAPAPATSPVLDRAVLDRAVADRVLDRAAAAMTAKRRVEVEVLESALAWAHAHTVSDEEVAAGWRSETIHTPGSAAALFGERPLPIAGEGAPLVAEFAVVELSGVLEQSHEATLALLGDVLDLAHRLPRLWTLVQDLTVPVRLGREAARVSRDLDPAAAGHADRLLAWQPRRLNPHRIGVLVHEARLYADPDRAIADHDHALESRRVEVHHEQGAPGVSEVFMSLDVADAVAFDHTVSTMATTMRALGHPGDLGVRRAHAVGLLADPQQALDILAAADVADPDRDVDPDRDETVCVAEEAAYATPDPFRRPTTDTPTDRSGRAGRSGEVRLVLHVTDRDLLADPHTVDPYGVDSHTVDSHTVDARGVARSDELGPMLLGRLQTWLLTAGKVTIAPVLDVEHMAPVDAHDPPAPMAAAVRLRDATCVFPGCSRPSGRADLDHIVEYVPLDEGGPPGQTHPANLAPLCRRHHRAKTFGAFTYHRRPDGAYEWTLPTRRRILTDPPRPRPRPGPGPGPGPEPRSRP
ncbi:HNH endonuclease signature motif containing protein [Nocardioides eburneiflavus]|uniref:HNH endonuclease signature motif containing protein n=1 Tax=Nocardioides eburneiflavus TaxID=2518372 RepID=UPI00143DB4BE|nr:HNH endonuclease signature motif containing protein [Nocardioides eburneiflavus]